MGLCTILLLVVLLCQPSTLVMPVSLAGPVNMPVLQNTCRDIANSNSNLHSNNIHCIILYYSSIQLIQLWFLTWCVPVAGLLQSAVRLESIVYL